MAEIVNLKLARKRKERDDREALAAENRAKFGRSKSEKQKERAEQADASRKLNGHKLDE